MVNRWVKQILLSTRIDFTGLDGVKGWVVLAKEKNQIIDLLGYLSLGFFNLAISQCTEGWECNLGLGRLEIFFADNGLWGFLGPNWKVFHHGTLREHF